MTVMIGYAIYRWLEYMFGIQTNIFNPPASVYFILADLVLYLCCVVTCLQAIKAIMRIVAFFYTSRPSKK